MIMMKNNIIEIDDLMNEKLWAFKEKSEVQLLRCNEPKPGVFVAESPNVIERAMDAGYKPISFLVEKKKLTECEHIFDRCPDADIYTADESVLVGITGFKLTRGLLCRFERKPLNSVEEICKNARRVAVLEDVVNPTNVGAIFRSAAAMFVDAVILTNACSDPLYRRAARVSMGNVFLVPWTVMDKRQWPDDAMHVLKQSGFKFAAMALTDDSVRIDDEALKKEEKLVIVLGTEGQGLKADTIEKCDYTVKIPMASGVDSLNVAAASAVAFWELSL